MMSVAIYFYRTEEPLTIPLPGLDATEAQSYFERLKSHIIEAQLHNDRRVSIKPPALDKDMLILDPSTIRQATLVDTSEPAEPTPDEIPAVRGTGTQDDAAVEARGLHPEVQRRIRRLLG